MVTVDKLGDVNVQIYVEHSGNPTGIPVIYLHGGPGDHTAPYMRRWYNPARYHIVLMDQRGCGKSTPRNHLSKNTTSHLISDMEVIRASLGVDSWVVTGGSWGTTLALLYAIKYPHRTRGLILRGVFDLDMDANVLDLVYPDDADELEQLVGEPLDTIKFYNKTSRILQSSSSTRRRKLIHMLAKPDSMYVISKPAQKDSFRDQETLAIIGNHYEKYNFFVSNSAIKRGLHRIRHLPIFVIEGRYDLVTPMTMSYHLCKQMPHCTLNIVRGGHTANEPEVQRGIVAACNAMLKKLK